MYGIYYIDDSVFQNRRGRGIEGRGPGGCLAVSNELGAEPFWEVQGRSPNEVDECLQKKGVLKIMNIQKKKNPTKTCKKFGSAFVFVLYWKVKYS
jgi:hypothetical protein